MEAVAAIGVAAAAMQFLDFSMKTLALCKQIRDSSTGSTEVNAELTKSTKELKGMQKELRQAGNTSSSIYRKLLQAVKERSLVADELLQLLRDFRELALKNFGAVRSACKVLKDSRKIEKLQKRLTDCQAKFTTALTMDVREGVLKLLETQGVLNDNIQNAIMPKLEQLQIQSSASHSTTQSQLRTLERDLKSSVRVTHMQLAANHVEQQASSKHILQGQSSLGQSINRRLDEASDSSQHRSFLEGLYFDDMFARQQSIMPQSHGTYDWVLSGKSPLEAHRWSEHHIEHDIELRGSLFRRLQDERTVFWVNGKAGSGKSSLMSFIESDKWTEAALKVWARTRKLYTFSFFFWRPGSPLQKSIAGLLRSILYQLSKAIPSVVARIISNRPSLTYTDWTQAKLLEALKIAFEVCQNDGNGSVFLLIDGLDEFEGSYTNLIDVVMGLQYGSSTKLCVSSRPETAFNNKLTALPSISLQELNFYDIGKYVTEQLRVPGNTRTRLTHEVTDRAEGIFLWAVLVCQSIIAGRQDGDDEEALTQRLSIIPSGPKDLFHSMFSKIDEMHRKDLSLYFVLLGWRKVTENYDCYSLIEIDVSVALVERMLRRIPYESSQHFFNACETTHRRVIAQSKGLIQVVCTTKSVTRGWAFKDVATGSARHQFLDEAESESMYKCTHNTLEWVHRSAHDWIFGSGDSSGFLTSDMVQLNQSDFERRIVEAFTWLAQYTPALVDFDPEIGSKYEQLLETFTLPIRSATSSTETEIFQALDTIHDAMQSSLCDTKDLVDRFLSRGESSVRFDLTVVLNFWTTLILLDDYWVARFELIKSSAHARLICCALLDRLVDFAFGIHFTDQRKRLELELLLTKFLIEEYSRVSQGACIKYLRKRRYIGSWTSSGHSDEESEEVILLVTTCVSLNKIADSDHHAWTGQLDDSKATFLATFDARQLFVGEDGEDLPLQILLPLQYAIYDHKTVFPSSFRRMRANLRLICITENGNGDFDHKHLDLSVRLTSYMLQFRIVSPYADCRIVRMTGMAFAGTLQQREECVRLIIEESWQNNDDQLDAWHQLYLLACVKNYFCEYWSIVTPDDGNEAREIADQTGLSARSTSSGSPQQPTRPSDPYSASPSKHPSAKAPPHPQPDP